MRCFAIPPRSADGSEKIINRDDRDNQDVDSVRPDTCCQALQLSVATFEPSFPYGLINRSVSFMGRINLKPVRVRQAASQLLQTPRLRTRPPWFDVLGSVPPTQALVRTQPVQLDDRPKRMRIKKPSKLFKPQRIEYQEDGLRRDFFGDHPWELARPRVVLEDDGKDEQRADWSRLGQVGKGTDGER